MLIWASLFFATALLAQEPRLTNATVQRRPAAGGLEKSFQAALVSQTQPLWIGYSVPIVDGNHRICCNSGNEDRLPAVLRHGHCLLEGHNDNMNFQTNDESDNSPRQEHLVVLFRAANGQVGKIRVFTEDCELDAGGLTVCWLDGVQSGESVTLLSRYVTSTASGDKTSRQIADSALTAVALHADPAADLALDSFTAPSLPREVRKNAAFWLGNVCGQKGCDILKRLLQSDQDKDVREQCVFALTLSKSPDALAAIIKTAHQDPSAHVRGQALFWLGQRAGEKAVKAITDAIENDPQTDVKKKAVFALSQLPKQEGVPRLIEVARKNRNREVRKDAMFWLGQSNDDRALAFFEEVLVK
jgi:hypothetical protein